MGANGCFSCHVNDELWWLWRWLWNCHDVVPTVHATSACPDYGSPAVHATSACPEYCSPADAGSAGTNDERCFFRKNQHDQRCFFRNHHKACLVTQERDNASCKVPR